MLTSPYHRRQPDGPYPCQLLRSGAQTTRISSCSGDRRLWLRRATDHQSFPRFRLSQSFRITVLNENFA
jgi:hypothetical protein